MSDELESILRLARERKEMDKHQKALVRIMLPHLHEDSCPLGCDKPEHTPNGGADCVGPPGAAKEPKSDLLAEMSHRAGHVVVDVPVRDWEQAMPDLATPLTPKGT